MSATMATRDSDRQWQNRCIKMTINDVNASPRTQTQTCHIISHQLPTLRPTGLIGWRYWYEGLREFRGDCLDVQTRSSCRFTHVQYANTHV